MSDMAVQAPPKGRMKRLIEAIEEALQEIGPDAPMGVSRPSDDLFTAMVTPRGTYLQVFTTSRKAATLVQYYFEEHFVVSEPYRGGRLGLRNYTFTIRPKH